MIKLLLKLLLSTLWLLLLGALLFDWIVKEFDKMPFDPVFWPPETTAGVKDGIINVVIWLNKNEEEIPIKVIFWGVDINETVLLKNVTNYQKIKDKLYVTSKDGYCVADGKKCKIFITAPDEYVRFTDSKNVSYIESFEKFSKKDRTVFQEMTGD